MPVLEALSALFKMKVLLKGKFFLYFRVDDHIHNIF